MEDKLNLIIDKIHTIDSEITEDYLNLLYDYLLLKLKQDFSFDKLSKLLKEDSNFTNMICQISSSESKNKS